MLKIALLGAESTGTTALAQALASRTPHSIADNPALMAAVCSDLQSGDDTLYPAALEQQRCFDLTLVAGLDLPWADARQCAAWMHLEALDARLRAALAEGRISYQVVYGNGLARLRNAIHAIDSLAARVGASSSGRPRIKNPTPWTWNCEKCSDPECEHRLFSGLLNR